MQPPRPLQVRPIGASQRLPGPAQALAAHGQAPHVAQLVCTPHDVQEQHADIINARQEAAGWHGGGGSVAKGYRSKAGGLISTGLCDKWVVEAGPG